MNTTVLVIDDEEKLRRLLVRIIGLEGYPTLEAATLREGEKIVTLSKPAVVLCDVKLPDGNGVAFVSRIKAIHPAAEVILLTAFGHIADGVQAMKNGAFDYIVKGDDNERIIPLLARAAEKVRLVQKVDRLEGKLSKKYSFDKIIGSSTPLLTAINAAKKVANTEASVLLTGETGTGKEVFAQAIHYGSQRKSGNFVALNCSSFSKDLMESELFGYKAGAFTGAANKDHKGLIEEANGGTLFLDELGEMPTELQPKLLRFLESGTYYRVGDSKEHRADVRIFAATNKDLISESNHGRFRSDLYYRIAVFTILLPSLRERRDDIPVLAEHYLQNFGEKLGRGFSGISPQAVTLLLQHTWPGNIRELKKIGRAHV